MTVCIAAACESGKKIVIAADRMLTFPYPTNLEFETEETKIEELSPSCVALVSGNSAYATELLQKSRKAIGGNQFPEISQVFDIVKSDYLNTRMAKINETILFASLGPDYDAFLKKGGTLPTYLQVQPQSYQQLFMFMQGYNLNVEIIIAGIDNSGAHVGIITHPGSFVSLEKLGYGAIGSGGMHATINLSLNGQTSQKKLVDALWNVYAAKKASEAAPGVGQVTDIAVVELGRVVRCKQPIMVELSKIYDKISEKQSVVFKALEEAYHEQCKS